MPFELPAVAGAMAASALIVRLVRGSLAARCRDARGPQRAPGLRPRGHRAPQLRALVVSRRRAHLDRDVRARRGARKGARALRLPSRRSAAGDDRDREHPRGACADPPPRRCPHDRGAGRAGGLDRDLRLDAAASRRRRLPCARQAGPRAPAPARDERADARAARGGRRRSRASASAWSMQRTRTRRLPPEIFDLPVEKMREGYYSDVYFNFARDTLLADGRHPRVVMQVFQRKHAVLGGMDEAIAILKLCSHDWDALTVHALYDGDQISPWETVLTIEGDFTLFAHLETSLPRRARAADADLDERAARGRGGERQADPLLPRPARPPPRPDRGRLCGARRRRDRRLHGRAGLLVGRARLRDGAARAHLRLRREHRARGDEVRRARGSRPEHRRAGRLRERLGADGAGSGARARAAALGRPARHVAPARRPLALGGDGRLRSARRERAPGVEGARGARRGRLRAREDRRLGRVRRRADLARSSVRACRWTPTASARRSSAARTTSPPTSSSPTAGRRRRSAADFRPNPRLELVE